jgi:hypothetical protein
MALEDLLREAAAKGLTHLSIHPVPSEDGKKVYWRATATPSTGHQYVQAANQDLIVALELVLKSLPRATRRRAEKISEPQMEVTATVKSEPEPQEEIDRWLPKT